MTMYLLTPKQVGWLRRKLKKHEHKDRMLSAICQEVATHSTTLRDKSGKGEKWEDGFLEGLMHVRDHLVPLVFGVQPGAIERSKDR